MLFGFALLFFIAILWLFFVRGYLFKLILFVAGWFGLYQILWIHERSSHSIAITIAGTDFTWASVIPTVVCVLVLLTTRSDS